MTTRPYLLTCRTCGTQYPLGSDRCPSCGDTPRMSGGILQLGAQRETPDYRSALYERIADVEMRHFWFRGRNELIVHTLVDVVGTLTGRRALDIGCGTGHTLAALEGAGMVTVGTDINLPGLLRARRRVRGPLVHDPAGSVPFREQFDVTLLCDVLEHADDDSGLLRRAASTLVPGGVTLVTVPALPILWSVLDERWGHKRRYTRRTLAAAMMRAGIRPVLVRYFNFFLVPAIAGSRLLAAARGTVPDDEGFALLPAPLNALFGAIFRAETSLRRIAFPVGGSIIAIGRSS